VSENDAVLFRAKCGGAAKTQGVTTLKIECRSSQQAPATDPLDRQGQACPSKSREIAQKQAAPLSRGFFSSKHAISARHVPPAAKLLQFGRAQCGANGAKHPLWAITLSRPMLDAGAREAS
jgi:hypothetical protein